jgi:hypothetical protein
MLIMSATGPVLIFESSLYTMCINLGIEKEFLTIRVWVGMLAYSNCVCIFYFQFLGVWMLIMATLLVAFDGACLMKYVTKFTMDIFASLISIIFIVESGKFIVHVSKKLVDQIYNSCRHGWIILYEILRNMEGCLSHVVIRMQLWNS